MSDSHFIPFKDDISHIPLPEQFTFPFAYSPHALSKIAAAELTEVLKMTENRMEVSGKMYGVLVVENSANQIGYLAAFSGQEEDFTQEIAFVPSLHNRLEQAGFFLKEEEEITKLGKTIRSLAQQEDYLLLQNKLAAIMQEAEADLLNEQKKKHTAKMQRKQLRETAKTHLNETDFASLLEDLRKESIEQFYHYKAILAKWKNEISEVEAAIQPYSVKIQTLKSERKQRSAALQQQLFEQYQFLNANGKVKALKDIFSNTAEPPAGAGDCCAPKLLQYAYQQHMKPLVMAEFWYGKPPKSELRQEGKFYPACSRKCRPILAHMLQGLPVEQDPMDAYVASDKEIEMLYEDDYLAVINKPAGLLSTPSRAIKDSVFSRMQKRYPQADGPLIAHRLDKLTSGLMIICKSLAVYTQIQEQFMNREVSKHYLALLDGRLEQATGEINLPLTVDEDNRPMQKVCFETGRSAKTYWHVIKKDDEQTLVQFQPITGRTHQLRVHAAHPAGLKAPIVGDPLYGNQAERLMLHARNISFSHPESNKKMEFEVKAVFE